MPTRKQDDISNPNYGTTPWLRTTHLGPEKPSHVFLEHRLIQLAHEQFLARFQHVLIQRLLVILGTAVPQYLLLHARRALRVVHTKFDRNRIGS